MFFKIAQNKQGYDITIRGQVLFYGIGTQYAALEIARQHGLFAPGNQKLESETVMSDVYSPVKDEYGPLVSGEGETEGGTGTGKPPPDIKI